MKRGTLWPVAVAGILGLTVAGNIWLIRVASGDPSFAVEENYYQRGVHWDDEMAQRARNIALGWKLAASLSPIRAGRGSDLRIALSGCERPKTDRTPVNVAFLIDRSGSAGSRGRPG